MTFKQWVKQYKDEYSARGDLAQRITIDKKFPRSRKLDTLIAHIIKNGAPDTAIDVLKDVYEDYVRLHPQK